MFNNVWLATERRKVGVRLQPKAAGVGPAYSGVLPHVGGLILLMIFKPRDIGGRYLESALLPTQSASVWYDEQICVPNLPPRLGKQRQLGFPPAISKQFSNATSSAFLIFSLSVSDPPVEDAK
ncbi:hypothetical protein BJX66DRAFT_121678 [Aspergillus keveii]|uniref:Uncharacterized protein n=1 Tax=Aspergillus keveii TaxID=714993 RepID=A0ABR4FJX1_9EURO